MGERSGRYGALTDALVERVLSTPGHTSSDLRRAVLARAARLGGTSSLALRSSPPDPLSVPERGDSRHPSFPLSRRERGPEGEDALTAYLDKVARHAYKVTDEDLAALQRAGHSDDALFEVTVSAALGAALGRLERGLAALRGEEPD